MQIFYALTALMALGASAAPTNETETTGVEARGYNCGYDAYFKDGCCQCKIPGQVYNKNWHGCSFPNPKADEAHKCHGDSYYDYHRNCCACSKTTEIYFKEEKSCQSCGVHAVYDYNENKCKCKHRNHHYDEHKKGCFRD